MILVTSKFWPTERFRHYAFLPVEDFPKAKMMGLFFGHSVDVPGPLCKISALYDFCPGHIVIPSNYIHTGLFGGSKNRRGYKYHTPLTIDLLTLTT